MTIKNKLLSLSLFTFISVLFIALLMGYMNKILLTSLTNNKSESKHLQQFLNLKSSFLDVSELYNNAIVLVMMGEDTGSISKMINRRLEQHDKLIIALKNNNKSDLLQMNNILREFRKKIGKGFKLTLEGNSYGASEYYVSDLKSTINELRKIITNQINEKKEYLEKNYSQLIERYYSIRKIVIISGMIAILFLLLNFYYISKRIIQSISIFTETIQDIAEGDGDLTVRIDTKTKDEISNMAKHFNQFVLKLHTIFKDIALISGSLIDSSRTLSVNSGEMSEFIVQMSEKSTSVLSAAEQVNANVSSAATASKQAATNVDKIVTSSAEMTSTIDEIANHTENARTTANQAAAHSETEALRVTELGKAVGEISNVTETITEISDQTNLLALNATIEAARAGELGKGFAVVASEIKELARQTSNATNEIKNTIGGVQKSTNVTVSNIKETSAVIKKVDGIVSTIAGAIEQQSSTTKEIAGFVVEASREIQDINKKMVKNSAATDEITQNITTINQSSNEISNTCSNVKHSSGELFNLAEQLREIVAKFRI